ncbi:NAD(P)/FAD-dependent oxidoreductase [Lacticaseibacillus pabuli]|uniref:Ferredoxin--NADP reductase n=1 Tax=Lacticaseibacillus pabuli TaxID=3025672 RepID=A0ABY7WUI3_9LACO|nr:NAD(P)/FAD-dependent oxidoreductase [Lacticaseibacillus sp. KACC 23028]WDF83426.1 NAD(P)/FAD-dependent oxidoreductase [Lacticaseibacillus sp. KACC 23028]
MHEYDIAIIGGGPIGMFAAFYANLRSADVLLLESRSELGGQPVALYPQKTIYDIPGFFGVSGTELTARLAKQLGRFSSDIRLNTKVIALTPDETGVTLSTDRGDFRARSVIVATGAGAFEPRPLTAKHPVELEGTQIIYTPGDLNDFANQNVLVAGGGDSAIDWALALEPIAASVGIIHRREAFRGLESSVTALQNSAVTIHTPYLIQEVRANDNGMAVELRPLHGAAPATLHADKLLVNYGFASDNRQLRDWGLDLTRGQINVASDYKTSLPNVYAIGDAVTYPDKQKLIATGFGEAPAAINAIMRRLHPEIRQTLHSADLNL